jgi:hypothetical protein
VLLGAKKKKNTIIKDSNNKEHDFGLRALYEMRAVNN